MVQPPAACLRCDRVLVDAVAQFFFRNDEDDLAEFDSGGSARSWLASTHNPTTRGATTPYPMTARPRPAPKSTPWRPCSGSTTESPAWSTSLPPHPGWRPPSRSRIHRRGPPAGHGVHRGHRTGPRDPAGVTFELATTDEDLLAAATVQHDAYGQAQPAGLARLRAAVDRGWPGGGGRPAEPRLRARQPAAALPAQSWRPSPRSRPVRPERKPSRASSSRATVWQRRKSLEGQTSGRLGAPASYQMNVIVTVANSRPPHRSPIPAGAGSPRRTQSRLVPTAGPTVADHPGGCGSSIARPASAEGCYQQEPAVPAARQAGRRRTCGRRDVAHLLVGKPHIQAVQPAFVRCRRGLASWCEVSATRRAAGRLTGSAVAAAPR